MKLDCLDEEAHLGERPAAVLTEGTGERVSTQSRFNVCVCVCVCGRVAALTCFSCLGDASVWYLICCVLEVKVACMYLLL